MQLQLLAACPSAAAAAQAFRPTIKAAPPAIAIAAAAAYMANPAAAGVHDAHLERELQRSRKGFDLLPQAAFWQRFKFVEQGRYEHRVDGHENQSDSQEEAP
jgi:hypothetical protein